MDMSLLPCGKRNNNNNNKYNTQFSVPKQLQEIRGTLGTENVTSSANLVLLGVRVGVRERERTSESFAATSVPRDFGFSGPRLVFTFPGGEGDPSSPPPSAGSHLSLYPSLILILSRFSKGLSPLQSPCDNAIASSNAAFIVIVMIIVVVVVVVL
uniref:Uncharacterized protein n=1 Tax=Physcomitrium patens TaxID=3218 RepID=A0A2K1IEA6_PHYPA|nr:hypothetical protein PHYPA_029752 [Physcomitrium patens]